MSKGLQDLVIIAWIFHQAWLLFTHGFITVFLNQSQPAGLPSLTDDSYEIEATLQISKRGAHAKVKQMGYDLYYNQWIKLFELRRISFKVVKTFLKGGSERELVFNLERE